MLQKTSQSASALTLTIYTTEHAEKNSNIITQVPHSGRCAGQGPHDRGGDGGGQADQDPAQAASHARHLGQDQGCRGPDR
jgi:hypothetical protein